MGFFNVTQKVKQNNFKGVSIELLHEMGCKTCPLNNQRGLKHPQMDPYGSKKPIIYILGEAPGFDEDMVGKPFAGKEGRVLRSRIPDDWNKYLRWNNCVRTRPPEDRNPVPVEIECCRPSIVKDIEKTKPQAIFGFGNVPLQWALSQSGVMKWHGRNIPVKIGTHTCWYFPMMHPSFVQRTRRFTPRKKNEYGSDIEFAFANDLKRAFSLIEKLPTPVIHTKEYALENVDFVTGENGSSDVDRVLQYIDHLYTQKIVGLDYETNGLRPYNDEAKILTVGLSTKNDAFAFPLRHSQAQWSVPNLKVVEQAYKRFLYEAPCRKVVHQLSFEQEWSGFFYGKDVLRSGKWGDSISQAYVLDERRGRNKPGCLSLDFLCLQYFGLNLKAISALNRKKLDDEPLDRVLHYNALDAKYHRLLYNVQYKRLKAENLLDVYNEQLRRVPTMVLTQLKGVPVDQKIVSKLHNRYLARIEKAEDRITNMKIVGKFRKQQGYNFSPSSPKDVSLMLKNYLHIKADSTDEKVLEEVDHPIAATILRYRKNAKLLSTYVEPLRPSSPHLFSDGRLHPILNTTSTDTWRTSSEDPNAQNFPVRQNKEVRSQIKPKANERVVSFDYASIQGRNIAMESKDRALVAAFWDRYDIHADWCERIAKRYPRWVDGGVKALKDKDVFRKYRNRAKNELVFPCFFGAHYKSVARYLGIPENVCGELHEDFWGMFPDIKGWQERITKNYYRKGYVTGLTGFRRRAPISPNQLINAPIQADESAIVCDAMTRLSEIDHDRLQASLEIHDDLTFIWHKDEIDELAEIVIREMLACPYEWAHIVPIGIEMKVGKNWANQEEVGEFYSDNWDGTVPEWRV